MKRRVLFWTDSFPPYIGGVEVLAAQYVRAMRAKGYEFVIVTRYEGDELVSRDDFEGVPLYRLNVRAALSSRSPLQLLQLRRAISEVAREFAPDLLHIYHVGMGAMLFDGLRNIPRLLTLHSPIAAEHLVPNSALSTLLESVDYVACCSRSVAQDLWELAPTFRGRSSAISNTLEMPDLQPTPISFEPPRLLALGRLVEAKGFDVAIEAFAALKPRFPSLQMTIAGNGPAFDDLNRLVESKGLQDSIAMPGWVAPEEVPKLISAHTLTVMPSRIREAFGLVALQAAQMARPVVASRLGGIPEVVEDGVSGALVEPDDVEGFGTAIESLLREPEKAAEMGIRARERALTRFTWPVHVAAYDELMQQLTANRNESR
ncbi:glycosyltransferase family 1 protein [bacterium]|nr:MAG: glycosyltransferase family 1 protein [bacterium]